MPLPDEIWKLIPSLEGYEASSLGRIRSPYRILKIGVKDNGYLSVGVMIAPYKQKNMLVHRLVCMAFHGLPPYEEAQARHRNDDKNNCTPDNLCWGTPIDNAQDRARRGGYALSVREEHTGAKLNWPKVREIRQRVGSGESGCRVADAYGIHPTMVSKIIRNKFWPLEKDPEYAISR